MPASAVKSLTRGEHASTSRAKRAAIKKGKQFAANTPAAKIQMVAKEYKAKGGGYTS